jgi:hypothetical protein
MMGLLVTLAMALVIRIYKCENLHRTIYVEDTDKQ